MQTETHALQSYSSVRSNSISRDVWRQQGCHFWKWHMPRYVLEAWVNSNASNIFRCCHRLVWETPLWTHVWETEQPFTKRLWSMRIKRYNEWPFVTWRGVEQIARVISVCSCVVWVCMWAHTHTVKLIVRSSTFSILLKGQMCWWLASGIYELQNLTNGAFRSAPLVGERNSARRQTRQTISNTH